MVLALLIFGMAAGLLGGLFAMIAGAGILAAIGVYAGVGTVGVYSEGPAIVRDQNTGCLKPGLHCAREVHFARIQPVVPTVSIPLEYEPILF